MGFEPNAQQKWHCAGSPTQLDVPSAIRYCVAPYLSGTTPVTTQRLVHAANIPSIHNVGVQYVVRVWFTVSVAWALQTLTVGRTACRTHRMVQYELLKCNNTIDIQLKSTRRGNWKIRNPHCDMLTRHCIQNTMTDMSISGYTSVMQR